MECIEWKVRQVPVKRAKLTLVVTGAKGKGESKRVKRKARWYRVKGDLGLGKFFFFPLLLFS